MIERGIVDLRGEVAGAEARIVLFIQICAMADQQGCRFGLIRQDAFHQGGFAFGVRGIDRNVTVEQLLDFGGAAGGGGAAKVIDIGIDPGFGHGLGCIRSEG